MHRSTKHRLLFSGGFALPIIVTLLVLVSHSSHGSSAPPLIYASVNRPTPFPGGKQTDLNTAQRTVAFPVKVPSTSEASSSTVTDVWVTTQPSPQVQIDFSSGMREVLWPNEIKGSFEDWAREQIAEGVPGQILKLDSVPVFSVPPDPQDPGSVSFVSGGTFIQVIGHGDFTSQQLEDAASSIIAQLSTTS